MRSSRAEIDASVDRQGGPRDMRSPVRGRQSIAGWSAWYWTNASMNDL
jgi:hypothetical protein